MVRPKLAKLLNKKIRVILADGRQIVGKLLSFDGHMNLVLDEAQEFRKSKDSNTVQRALGVVMLRGDTVVSTISEASYMGNQEARLTTQPIVMQL